MGRSLAIEKATATRPSIPSQNDTFPTNDARASAHARNADGRSESAVQIPKSAATSMHDAVNSVFACPVAHGRNPSAITGLRHATRSSEAAAKASRAGSFGRFGGAVGGSTEPFTDADARPNPPGGAAGFGSSSGAFAILVRCIIDARMDHKSRVRVSKLMSLGLRHDPAALGLALDDAGWVSVESLRAGLSAKGETITIEDVSEIVRTSDKQRFALSADGARIRANQGHSVDVELGLTPKEPPAVLFHGTSEEVLPQIRESGILRMARTHVHLSADEKTAEIVAKRRAGPTVILLVDAAAMHGDGHEFYQSENGVWLTHEVPARYLKS